MLRPTFLHIDIEALKHNFSKLSALAGDTQIIAMVKSNAYGCGLDHITQALTGKVGAFGVACLAEALAIRGFGLNDQCLIFQGVYTSDEWEIAANYGFEVVLHHRPQLEWLLSKPLSKPVKVWLKMNTGMHRLGFPIAAFDEIFTALKTCPWVDASIGLMTHFACADEPLHQLNTIQLAAWNRLIQNWQGPLSACNSAASMVFKAFHGTHVRPGLLLYGVSPFADKTGLELGFKPVMRYHSAI
jgi:alanine racemase